MKKSIFALGALGISLTLITSSCLKPAMKDYTCECVYTADGKANINETSTVSSDSNMGASYDCGKKAGQYISQEYIGTCNLK
ncbi:MAG: hypothetical protein JNL72_12020 [Flavipsychrobacter sp.]|nr:hypothetical protein [Flavipsychrobacter sp.]